MFSSEDQNLLDTLLDRNFFFCKMLDKIFKHGNVCKHKGDLCGSDVLHVYIEMMLIGV